MTRRYHPVRFPRAERREVPDSVFALAEGRTKHLGATALREPLGHLLVSAYLQGLNDAVRVIEKNGLPEPAEPPPVDPRDYGLR